MTATAIHALPPTQPSTAASFDVHNLVAVRVDSGTPGEPQLRDMLAPFLGESHARLEIRVSGRYTVRTHQSQAEDQYRFTADSLYLPTDRVQVLRAAKGFRVEGTGELLTAVVPMLDRLCVMQGAAMIHAAVVDYRGAGVLLPAGGGVGKTSTVAKLVALPGVRFMADDWAFLTGRGDLLGYAKPLFIKPHHRDIYPQLFKGNRKPLAPNTLIGPISRLATAVHPVIVRYPRVAAFTRTWSPEHRMIPPAQVFGSDNIASSAPARLAIFLERYDGDEAVLEQRTTEWMATRMVGNFHTELPTVSRRLIEALGSTGLVPLEEHFSQKVAAVTRGLATVPCSRLRVPASWSADRASDQIAAVVQSSLADVGVREAPDERA